MPRTASVLAMSLTDLQRIIRNRQRGLQKLERQRSKWQRKLDEVERQIAKVAGSARGSGRSGSARSRPRNELSLVEAISKVLSGAGRAMNVGDIAEKVRADGYRSGSANFRAIVNQTLIKERRRFKNAGRGMYRLENAAAGGGSRKPRRARRKKQAKK